LYKRKLLGILRNVATRCVKQNQEEGCRDATALGWNVSTYHGWKGQR